MTTKIPMGSVTNVTLISSNTKFSYSPDKKLLLYSIKQGPSDAHRWGETGLFIYDVEQKKSRRLIKEGSAPDFCFAKYQ